MPFSFSWSSVDLGAVVPAVLQTLVGGVITSCSLWIPTEERLAASAELKRQTLREAISKNLHSLLSVAVGSNLSMKELRGSPPQTPDHVGDFTKEVFRVADVFREVDRMQWRIQAGHSYLLVTVLLGVLALLISLVLPASVPTVGILCSLGIVSQLICVIYLRRVAQRFEEYERIT